MNKTQKEALRELEEKGCTDSEVIDFCKKHKISQKEAFTQISEWETPECCHGCKHIGLFDSMHPCTECSRPKKDFYEKR